jgi:hypothetical protein
LERLLIGAADVCCRNATEREASMSMGRFQLLIVLALSDSDFYGDLVAALERFDDQMFVRVIDALALYKDADGNVTVRQLNDPKRNKTSGVTSASGAVVGRGIRDEERTSITAEGAEDLSDTTWDLLAEIPTESAAALVLLEHHWALRLHDVIASVGGFRISDGFIISPLELDKIALASVKRSNATRLGDPAGSPATRARVRSTETNLTSTQDLDPAEHHDAMSRNTDSDDRDEEPTGRSPVDHESQCALGSPTERHTTAIALNGAVGAGESHGLRHPHE